MQGKCEEYWEIEGFGHGTHMYNYQFGSQYTRNVAILIDGRIEHRVARAVLTVKSWLCPVSYNVKLCFERFDTPGSPLCVSRKCDFVRERGGEVNFPLPFFMNQVVDEHLVNADGMAHVRITVEPLGKRESEGQGYSTAFRPYGVGASVTEIPPLIQRPVEIRHAPYAGLTNQGATCYMNSMLQALYHFPSFRKMIYDMDTTSDKPISANIPLHLQVLFARMQMTDGSCSTKELTHSFGWGSVDTLMQHDVQEFCRVLLDNLEMKMKGTEREGGIAKLFRGRYRQVFRCKNVDYESGRPDYFYDLSMVVKDCPDLKSSFSKYAETSDLSGDNQYDTGADNFGKQDASYGTEFLEFPTILQLHLQRFDFDYASSRMAKINSRFEFPEEIDLSEFVTEDQESPHKSNVYCLVGVLVHSGYADGGHYYAFLKPTMKDEWCEFNDSHVSYASKEKAIDTNFGGLGPGMQYLSYGAYMLFYVRKDELEHVYEAVPNEIIPARAIEYINLAKEREKKRQEEYEAREAQRTFKIVTDDLLDRRARNGEFGIYNSSDGDKVRTVTIRKDASCSDLYQQVAKTMERSDTPFRLFTVGYWGTIGAMVSDSMNAEVAEIGLVDRLYFYEENIGEDSGVDLDRGILIFAYSYVPKSTKPIAFCQSTVMESVDTVDDLAEVVRKFYSVSCDVRVFMLVRTRGADDMDRVIEVDTYDTLGSLNIEGNGCCFVIQPESDIESDYETDAPEDDLVSFFYIKGYPDNFMKYAKRVAMEIKFVAHYEGKSRRVSVPTTLRLSKVLSFIRKFAFDEICDVLADPVVVAYANGGRTCLTGRTFCKALRNANVMSDGLKNLWIEKHTTMLLELVQRSKRILYSVSDDAISCSAPRSLLVSDKATVGDLRMHAVKSIADGDMSLVRIAHFQGRTLLGILDDDEKELSLYRGSFRIEPIPDDQCTDTNHIIPVHIKSKKGSNSLQFYIPISEEDTVKDLRRYLCHLLRAYKSKEFINRCDFIFPFAHVDRRLQDEVCLWKYVSAERFHTPLTLKKRSTRNNHSSDGSTSIKISN